MSLVKGGVVHKSGPVLITRNTDPALVNILTRGIKFDRAPEGACEYLITPHHARWVNSEGIPLWPAPLFGFVVDEGMAMIIDRKDLNG